MVGEEGKLREGMGGAWWMRCALAAEKCVVVEDHVVVIGEVVGAGTYADWEGHTGLIYAEGKYRSVGEIVGTKASQDD